MALTIPGNQEKKVKTRKDLIYVSPFVYPTQITNLKNSESNRVIVLDLDETLVHSLTYEYQIKDLERLKIWTSEENMDLRRVVKHFVIDNALSLPGEGIQTRIYMIYRPGLAQFLSELTFYASVIIIWSAGQPKYVTWAYKTIFQGEGIPSPYMLMTSENCDEEKVDDHIRKFKKLEKVYQICPYARPDNTILIDNASYNTNPNPDNSILIPDYLPEPNRKSILAQDRCLKRIMNFLRQHNSGDVRKIDKSKIFKATDAAPSN